MQSPFLIASLPRLAGLSLLAALMTPLWASPVTPAGSDPTDAAAPIAAPPLSSALQRYRPAAEIEAADWRDSNRRVQEIGGWRAYAKEAARAAQAEAEQRQTRPATRSHSH